MVWEIEALSYIKDSQTLQEAALDYSKPTFVDLIQKHSPLYLSWNRQKNIKRKDTEADFFIHHEK